MVHAHQTNFATKQQILTKFGTTTTLGPPDPLSKQNSSWWPIAIRKIEKNVSKNFALILAKF